MASVRDVFFNTVFDLIQSNEDICVVSADLGAPSLDNLRKYFPERFINVGIAEQNLISIAAGLVMSGKIVVAYGLNPFPVTRAYDQIRCLMGELQIPITLCALNAGICSAEAGYTHMAIDTFNAVRCLPNVQIFNPADETTAEILALNTVSNKKPRYINFDKVANGVIYKKEDVNLQKGYFIHRKSLKNTVTLITYGSFVPMLKNVADSYSKTGISLQVADMFSLPIDIQSFLEDIKNSSYIVTLEENILNGGLGSYILEILNDNNMNIPVKRLGLDFSNGVPQVFMNRDYIRRQQRLNAEGVTSVIDSIIGGKLT